MCERNEFPLNGIRLSRVQSNYLRSISPQFSIATHIFQARDRLESFESYITNMSISPTLLKQLSESGSDVTLWYRFSPPNQPAGSAPQVTSAKMRVFFRTGNVKAYGTAGTLFWAPVSSNGTTVLDENNTARRFPVAGVAQLFLYKQSNVFRHPACEAIQNDLCFSLLSNQYELNLQFNSPGERELWFNAILQALEAAGRPVNDLIPERPPFPSVTSPQPQSSPPISASPTPSPTSASSMASPQSGTNATPTPAQTPAQAPQKKLALSHTPDELATILSSGSPFKKYDLQSDNGKIVVQDVTCFTSGIGRTGLLHWVPLGQPLTPIQGNTLSLGKITDILMRKKSVAFKSSDPLIAQAKDECCFALVTDTYTLSLEARNKEQRTAWQDGLIAMLTSAGKQLQRKGTNSNLNAGVTGGVVSPPPTTASASPAPTTVPASTTGGHHPRSSSEDQQPAPLLSPTQRRSASSIDGSTASAASTSNASNLATSMQSILSTPEAQSLLAGHNFHMYFLHPSTGQVVRQWAQIWLHPVSEQPDAPGFLYFTTKSGDRTLQPAQLFALSSITEMSGSNKAALFKSGLGVQAIGDHCMTITAGTSMAWTLELLAGDNGHPPSKQARDAFLKNVHTVMVKWRAAVAAAASSNSVTAQGPRGSISGTSASPALTAQQPSSSPSPTPAVAAEEVKMLKEGQAFLRHTSSANGTLETKQILVWFDDSPGTTTGPGMLYFISLPGPKIPSTDGSGRFPLGTVQTMAAGKESVLFKSAAAKAVPPDRALSVVSAALTLDLEAPSNDVRERWIKALHGVMVRHGRRAVEQRAQAAALAANGNTPMSPAPTHRSSVSAGGSLASPANVAGGTAATPTPSSSVAPIPTTEDGLNLLQQGMQVTVFYVGPKGEVLSAEINLFLVLPLQPGASLSGSSPPYSLDLFALNLSTLQWCSSSVRKIIEGQKLSIVNIKEMKEGMVVKDSSIMRIHPNAALIAPQRCFQILGSNLTLTLVAPTSEAKERFMLALDSLIKKVKVITATNRPRGNSAMVTPSPAAQAPTPTPAEIKRQSSSEEGGVNASSALLSGANQGFTTMVSTTTGPNGSPHPNPLSPNSPASPLTPVIQGGSGNTKPTLTTQDQKSSVTLLQSGQEFRFYSYHTDISKQILNEERVESIIIFFAPSNGVDSPGTLHWYYPGQPRLQNDRSRTFFLNQIKQMTAGKSSSAIFKSSIAEQANINCCFSLFSLNTIWNLEAPSSEIRENWMKALHQVLIRHGLKASDEKKALPGPAAALSPSPSSTPTPGGNGTRVSPPVPSSATPVASSSAALSSATRALPAKSSHDHANNNRTINFSDPTDFFVLQAKIGEGSYGAVYKALDLRDNTSVAIKILQFQGRDSLKLRKEIHILRQCHSPYIVGYKGAFQKSSNVWIVMSYCGGGSLTDIMQICQRTFSEAQVAMIMSHSLQGLAYLHSKGLIHRDIKGGNLLVDENCGVSLADFGVSSNLDKALGKNRTVIGTPHYMAPEVLSSDDYNEKADIWSLGITAYELAIGEPPHAKLHSMRAAIKIPTAPPPTLPEPHRFSPDFHSFIAASLVKDFHARPSAAELLQHPFILKAPSPSILSENVKAAMLELESRHESVDEINGLMGGVNGPKPGGGGKISMRGASSTRDGSGSASQSGTGTLDEDFDQLVMNDFGGSDTMRPIGGTMIAAGGFGGTRPLPSAGGDISDTMVMNSDTMVLNGAAVSLSDTVIAAAVQKSGIGSGGSSVAITPVPSSSVGSSDHDADDALEQFEADDDDLDAIGGMKIAEE